MQPDRMRCGAKVRNARGENATCRAWPVRGGTRCRMHGGLGQIGAANPNFRTGRYARLPARMLDAWREAQGDPELLSTRADIAAVDARIGDLVGRLDSGESGAVWRALREAKALATAARRRKDHEAFGEALTRIFELIDAGQDDHAAWAEIGEQMDRRRKLVESERKRLVDMHQTITADKALALARALMDAVERRVADPDVLAAISREAMSILNRQEAA